jgi:hypothetical protein
MSKQTAVEWLIEELKNELGYCVDLGYTDQIVLDKILNHYKEIEKQDTISFGYMCMDEVDAELGNTFYKKTPEIIYNEMFKNKEAK